MVVAGNTNIYMDAPTSTATEHFCSGWEACRFLRGATGETEDMNRTLHPSRHRLDTLPRKRVPPAVVPAGKSLGPRHGAPAGGRVGPHPRPPGAAELRGRNGAASSRTTQAPHPSSATCVQRSLLRRMNPPWRPGSALLSSIRTG